MVYNIITKSIEQVFGRTPKEKGKMFVLYYKEPYIVKEPMRKNCTCQSWRGKQLAMCEEEKPLLDYISNQKDKENYYIEKQAY